VLPDKSLLLLRKCNKVAGRGNTSTEAFSDDLRVTAQIDQAKRTTIFHFHDNRPPITFGLVEISKIVVSGH
jgi:hypothetical protein